MFPNHPSLFSLILTRVRSVKFLGIQKDDKLTFYEHISIVCSKISKTLAIIGKMSHFVSRTVLRNYMMVWSTLLLCMVSRCGEPLQRLVCRDCPGLLIDAFFVSLFQLLC